MKTTCICTFGLYVVLLLPILSFGYHIYIPDVSAEQTAVLDVSLSLPGCHYHMKHNDCKNVPSQFKLDKHTGILYSSHQNTAMDQHEKFCQITVSVKNCAGVHKIEFPLYFSFTPDVVVWANQAPMNITVHAPTMMENSDGSRLPDRDIFPGGGLQSVLPRSLRFCNIESSLPSRQHYWGYKISNGSVYIREKFLSENADYHKIKLLQYISDCIVVDGEVIVPNQEVVGKIKYVSALPVSSNKGFGELIQTSRSRVRRAAGRISFDISMRRVDVTENLPANTEVVALTLSNPNHIDVTFSWRATTDKRSLDAFSLDSRTGRVMTKRSLDRERMASHAFRVTALGSRGETAFCTLLISVLDMNDNKPSFERSIYRLNIREDESLNTYVGKVTASDEDYAQNQMISYSIQGLVPPNVFSINYNGEITLRKKLDREQKSEYSFNVIATDGGTSPQTASARVIVTVTDVNDVVPTFTRPLYHVSIAENTKTGTIIAQVEARDADAGINGQIQYSLVRSQDRNYFEINKDTGKISVISDIDFADHPNGFRVRVRAQDRGRPPKSKSCEVMVSIVDVNDNAPKFYNSPYVNVVSEDLPVHSEVLRVTANDPDDGENARITYSFITPPDDMPFHINNASGQITLVKPLDFEKQIAYALTVKATDHGKPPKSSTANIEIKVRDVNDNAPKFTKSLYYVSIPETEKVNRVIAQVVAQDLDKDSTLYYSIISGNHKNKFRITTRNNEGIVTLSRSLDFNERRSYLLTVMCSDGEKSSTSQIRINITDANTYVPEFNKSSYEVYVKEDIAVGTIVLTVHATDKDVGENARITYSLQDSSSQFSLDANSGAIRTKAKLDFDQDSAVYLTVVARDNGKPQRDAEAFVTIYLEDVNDNAPVFDQPSYAASVKENIKIGSPVKRIHASDKDARKNGDVWYTFDGGNNGNGDFSIDYASGVIRTASELDREHIAEYQLIAYAKDRGTPPLQTPIRIIVTIEDIDDNPPIFEKDVIVFNVSEDSSPGSVIAKLLAIDPDEGGQSKVSYELSSFKSMDLWDLDFQTGELSPTFQLDYEKKANYTLIVSAYSGQLVSQATVIINLIDVNDNAPVLKPFEIIFNNYRTDKPYAFPIGPIGKVPAFDPDVSSVLKYRFTSGNNDSLLILNGTSGELRLSSKLDNDREFVATFMVEVSDGKYTVTEECTLKVVPITDEMLTNSVTVRVQQMSQEDFLTNSMKQFTHGLGQILNVSTQDVYIFNVQNDTDVSPHAVVNVSFSAKRPGGNYFSTQHLQEQVYLNRSVLTNYSMQNVMPFDDNICLREPCENYMRCVSALYFNSTAPFVSTNTVLFRPIHPVSGLRCKCPEGFTGLGCENEVNLCHSSRCKNGGKCISVEGGYFCECNGTFAGRHCEVNLIGGQCSQASDICKNEATCHQFPAGGLRCDCKPGGLAQNEVTKFCELRGRSFQKGDFIMFSGITRQWRFTLSLSFATQERNGLLLYNGRFNHEHDYLALEIINGQVQLNFSTGQNYTVVSPFIRGGVSDGKWHTVEVEYRNKPKSEVFGKGQTGPSNIKVVTVTIDPDTCDPAISRKWNKNLGTYTCSQTVEQGGTKTSLDLTTPLLIGGVPKLPEQYQVRSRYFDGCIRDLLIDKRLVDMSSYVANHGSQPGCKALRDHCSDNPCSRGTCRSMWGTYRCDCERDFGGKRCERIQAVNRFQGPGCLKLRDVSNLPKPLVFPWKHTVSIRTTQERGTILSMAIGSTGEVQLVLQSGRLVYSVKVGRRGKQNVVNAVLNDGEWHEIDVEWKNLGKNTVININIDDGFVLDKLITNLPTLLATGSKFSSVFLGGHWNGARVENAFNGCIRGLEFVSGSVPSKTTSIAGSSLIPTSSRAGVSQGCEIHDPCSGDKCPHNSACIAKFDDFSCQCHKGFIGNRCESACVLRPCLNQGKCVLDGREPHGYRCQCSSSKFYGRTCNLEYQYPCPSGWWAEDGLICTPCNCPVDKNFDPDCGRHGGICKCKKNYYYSSEKGMCLPCDCYHVGSEGPACDETGQCKCKSSVIGKKCNKCSSNFAEVQDEGCVVQYGMCPQAYLGDVLWRRAEFGDTILALCPRGSDGHAKRSCDKEKGWFEPNLSNCTSVPYHELEKDFRKLETNKEYFDEHRVRMSMDAISRLYSASNSTDKMHEGDILMTYKLVMKILSTQNSLSGFDLTASRRKDFNKFLIDSTSHSLAPDNLDNWKSVQNNGRVIGSEKVSSARLLGSYEQYISALTNSLQLMWYKSIQVKSDNMELLVGPVSNKEDRRIDIANKHGDENEKLVSVTLFAPDKSDQKNLPENGTVGILEFSTIGDLLPMAFHDNRLDMKRPLKGFINSAVVSIVTHNRVNWTRAGRDLISLTFSLLRNDGSNPQCVFWNFTYRSDVPLGGWSQRGCSRKSSNKTHITCTCSHLTSFAVMSDEEVVSVLEELPVKIALYGSVTFIIICIVICVACTIVLQDVTSNHSKIHCNFGISVLMSEIFFAVGIMLTSNAYACMASAIFIHFFFMSTLAWVFVEGLHLYRMLKEKRNVDRGNMRIYYLIGWGVPGIITALSVGLDAKGFGNANFCWIRTDHLLVWSFVGPLLFCAVVYIILFVMTLGKYFSSKLPFDKRSDMRANLRSSFILLPVVSALWALALFAVNENKMLYYYLFSVMNVVLGILLVLLHCFFNKEVRGAIRAVKERRWQKAELNITKQHLLKNSLSQTPDASNGPRRINIGTSASSSSTTHTASRRVNHQNSATFHDDLSDDSESEYSDSSMSLASTHSSDEEDGDNKPMYLNVNNSNSWHLKNGHLPMRKPHNGGLVVHSTPKDKDDEEEPQPSYTNGTSSSFKTSLPTVSESNLEDEEEEEQKKQEQEQIEEPHYLAINSSRKTDKKLNEEKIELLPMQEMDSLPRKGILKNGRRSKPATPVRTDSLQRKSSPLTTSDIVTDETSLIKQQELMDKVGRVAVIGNSTGLNPEEQLL